MKLILLPISSALTFVSGMLFVLFPTIFFIAELEAMSQQKAEISFPQFNLFNNVSMLVVLLAGATIVLSTFVSRSHLLFSSLISAFVVVCGVFTAGVFFLSFIGRT